MSSHKKSLNWPIASFAWSGAPGTSLNAPDTWNMTATRLWGVSVRRRHRRRLLLPSLYPTGNTDHSWISQLCPQGRDDSGFRVSSGNGLLVSNLLLSIVSMYASVDTRSSREKRSVWRASLTHNVDFGFVFTSLEPFFKSERERGGQRANSAPSGTLFFADSTGGASSPWKCIIIVISLNGAAC